MLMGKKILVDYVLTILRKSNHLNEGTAILHNYEQKLKFLFIFNFDGAILSVYFLTELVNNCFPHLPSMN